MATRIVSHVRNALGLDLSMRAVLHAPGVAELGPVSGWPPALSASRGAQVNHLACEEV